MEQVQFDFAYMFKYSERPKTLAQRKFEDNVPEEVKSERLKEIIALQNTHSKAAHEAFVGRTCKVLIEGTSKFRASSIAQA